MMKFRRGVGRAPWLFLTAAFLRQVSGQTASPLILLQTVPVPNGTKTGATQANLNLSAFNLLGGCSAESPDQ
jgi:hypothetical protein